MLSCDGWAGTPMGVTVTHRHSPAAAVIGIDRDRTSSRRLPGVRKVPLIFVWGVHRRGQPPLSDEQGAVPPAQGFPSRVSGSRERNGGVRRWQSDGE